MSARRIYVGIDGSPTATHALAWAAHNYQQGDAITVVMAWDYPTLPVLAAPYGSEFPPKEVLQEAAERGAAAAIAEVQETYNIPMTSLSPFGAAAGAVIEAAEGADLIVVGTKGAGLSRVILGSVSRRILHRATIPVVVVPEDAPLDYSKSVIVGADGSPNSIAALNWALDLETEAIHVINGWKIPASYPPEYNAFPLDEIEAMSKAMLDNMVNDVLSKRADGDQLATKVHKVSQHGDARTLLTKSDLDPGLIVVGSRGHTGLAGVILGSVATHVAGHSSVPVAVIPSD